MQSTRQLAAALVALTALSLTACGGDKADQAAATPEPTAQTTVPEGKPVNPAPAIKVEPNVDYPNTDDEAKACQDLLGDPAQMGMYLKGTGKDMQWKNSWSASAPDGQRAALHCLLGDYSGRHFAVVISTMQPTPQNIKTYMMGKGGGYVSTSKPGWSVIWQEEMQDKEIDRAKVKAVAKAAAERLK